MCECFIWCGALCFRRGSALQVTSSWSTSTAGGARRTAAHPPVSWLPNRRGKWLRGKQGFFFLHYCYRMPYRLLPPILETEIWVERGSAYRYAATGRPRDPLQFFSSVNFHSVTVEDGRPGGVHHQSDVPFQAPEQLRGDPRRQIHSQISRGRHRSDRGELF